MPWWGWALVGLLALGVVDRLLLAAERRGWINYRRTETRRGTAARAALSMQQIFEPDKHHVVEAQSYEDDKIEREATGDPPRTRSTR